MPEDQPGGRKKRGEPAKPRTLSKERLTGRMRSELDWGVGSLGKGSVTSLALFLFVLVLIKVNVFEKLF